MKQILDLQKNAIIIKKTKEIIPVFFVHSFHKAAVESRHVVFKRRLVQVTHTAIAIITVHIQLHRKIQSSKKNYNSLTLYIFYDQFKLSYFVAQPSNGGYSKRVKLLSYIWVDSDAHTTSLGVHTKRTLKQVILHLRHILIETRIAVSKY